MIDMSSNYDMNLFIGFEIMTGKVDNDETKAYLKPCWIMSIFLLLGDYTLFVLHLPYATIIK